MTQCTATFETGANGNTIGTGDAGSATAWDAVTIGTNCTCTYDNTNPGHGTLGAKYVVGVTSTACYTEWNTALGTVTDHYGRLYLYKTANPAITTPIVRFGVGAADSCRISMASTGVLVTKDNANTNISIGSVAASSSALIRIEWHIVHSATVGSFELKLFNTAESAVASETLTSAASFNLAANATGGRFGITSAVTSTTFWMDDIVAGAASYPGPVATGGSLLYNPNPLAHLRAR